MLASQREKKTTWDDKKTKKDGRVTCGYGIYIVHTVDLNSDLQSTKASVRERGN